MDAKVVVGMKVLSNGQTFFYIFWDVDKEVKILVKQ
jgi:hypothetical protein